uniref:Phosphatidylinositol 3-kinase, catalytic subunit type 3 n=1 Tax=Eptatretus burgeri TaxID=7764 RepID=A0A8C4R0Q2_EPTBU
MAESNRFLYVYSCDLDLNVQLKIGSLEGKREQQSFKELLEDPMLKFSGLYEEGCSDLYVTCQVYGDGKSLGLPIRTSYKAFSTRWNWNEWIKLPVRYADLPRNAQLGLTVWDSYGPGKAVPVGGTAVSLFGNFGMFQQGMHDLKVWPRVLADGGIPTQTPGKPENEYLSSQNEGPRQGHMSRLAKREKRNSSYMYLMVEFPSVRYGDVDYSVVYYEKEGDETIEILLSPEIVKVSDPQLGKENLVESKHHKLARSLRSGPSDHDLKPNAATRDQLNVIVGYPPTKQLTSEEQDLVWKFRYYLTNQEKALTKFLKCVNWSRAQEAKQAVELLARWKPMDVEDALELLSPRYSNTSVRRYAVTRLQQADDEDLLMYLLQLVQALKYENYEEIKAGLEPSRKESGQTVMAETAPAPAVKESDQDNSQTCVASPSAYVSKGKETAEGESFQVG